MTQYALTHRGLVLFVYSMILVLGIQAITLIPKQESPEFPSWSAVVVTQFPGASSLKVEELITEKIEEQMRAIEELKHISSLSQTGISYVFLDIKDSIESVKPIWDNVRTRLGDLHGKLPQGASSPWLNNNFGKEQSIVLAVTGEGFSNREIVEVSLDLKKDLRTLPHIAQVNLLGAQEERIFIEFSPAKIVELGISYTLIAQILREQNVLTPGGEILVGPQSIRLEVTGEFKTVEDIANTVITLPGHKSIFSLKDIAAITRQYVDPPSMQMRYMGKESIGLVMQMKKHGQILELGQAIEKFLEKKRNEVYLGIDIEILNFQPIWVQKKLNDFSTNLWQAIVIVVVFMMLFLGWREGVIVGMLIPFSFLITLFFMRLFDIPLHQISIAALIISLGILVDNGIVITESIADYIKLGLSKEDAAIRSAKDLFIPLATATGTTVATFLPIVLAESAISIFCRSITFVVGMTLTASFFVSMTLIPLLSVYLLKEQTTPDPEKPSFVFLGQRYVEWMTVCLRYRYQTLLVIVFIFVLSIFLSAYVDTSFFPPSDRHQFVIDFYMPEGTDYHETRRQALKAEQYILETYSAEMKNMALYLGEGGPRFHYALSAQPRASNYAQFMINNHSPDETEKMMAELQYYFQENFEDAVPVLKRLETGPPVGAPLQIRVHGKDLERLYAYTQQLQQIVEHTPGTRDTRDDWGELIPKVSVVVNQDQARRVGVSSQLIAQFLKGVLTGYPVIEFREGTRAIPVIGRSVEEDRSNVSQLMTLKIPTEYGTLVPISQVAHIELQWEAGRIMHRNHHRTITINTYLDGSRSVSQLITDIRAQTSSMEFLPGYGIEFGGEKEMSVEANQSMMREIPLALAILILILLAQFSRVRKMLIILISIPLSFIGVVLGLLLAGYPFGFMAFLGVVSLSGIVVNNAILLIEQIDTDIADHPNSFQAVVFSGRRRTFPIMLTTVTTIFGLIPLATSGEFWGPMAITMMGGLLTSAMLTLVAVPLLYTLFYNIRNTPDTIFVQK